MDAAMDFFRPRGNAPRASEGRGGEREEEGREELENTKKRSGEGAEALPAGVGLARK